MPSFLIIGLILLAIIAVRPLFLRLTFRWRVLKKNWTWKDQLWDSLFYLFAFSLVFGFFLRSDGTNVSSVNVSSVKVNGQVIRVKEVKVIPIPPEIYKSMKDNPSEWSYYLTGHKKLVLLKLRGDVICSATAQGKSLLELEQDFKKYPKLNKAYFKYFETLPEYEQAEGPKCKGPFAHFCPKNWFKDNCPMVCIINPNTREMIVDNSKDANQILPLLRAYADWNKEPLLKKEK